LYDETAALGLTQSYVVTTRGDDFKLYNMTSVTEIFLYWIADLCVLLKVHLLIVLREIQTSFGVAKTFIIITKQR